MTLQVTVSIVATFQIYIFLSGNFPKVRLGLLRRRRQQRGRALQLGWTRGRSLRLEKARGLRVAARTDLGSGRLESEHLGSCHLGKSLGKVPLTAIILLTFSNCLSNTKYVFFFVNK